MRALLLSALLVLPLAADSALKAKVDTVNDAFAAAMLRGDAAAVAAFYTDDAQLYFFKGTTLKGRAAIQEFMTGMFKGMKVKAMKIVSEESHPMGDAILDQGHYEMTSEAEGKVQTDKARYIQVLKKGQDGQLLLFRDCPLPD
ncbi:hypothetical protein GETHLI_12330 [Geothrix limicola]|uniref:DUF4440 domain-containing protein n=1 Tax=Geothrix limicola TaxID=2927978 RepID=A0ABQ5QEG9_9BACT|nr:nuclear transport factor 2 family protein [Geothrix limicola]GLH72731.1 hypothetical protein GETHLI_12330 [Geothrix limicola]